MLECYDADLDALADLAGDFDFLSTIEREAWISRQWTEIAAATGWADELDTAIAGLRRGRIGLADVSATALAAFRRVARGRLEDESRSDRARVRAEVLGTIGAGPGEDLWRAELDVTSVASGVCYGLTQWRPRPPTVKASQLVGVAPGVAGGSEGGAKTPSKGLAAEPRPDVVTLPQRAFLADAGPSYFGPPIPSTLLHRPGCGWQTPLRLCLGTFPWVYGHRLQAPAPGLGWRSTAAHQPAAVALEIASGLWQPSGNLRQDAREVAAQWKHWRAATAPLVGSLPAAEGSVQRAGGLYRRGMVLEVFQGSEELVGLNGPRGFVCAAAYNFVQRRYAAFFAMRRALVRARAKLIPELRGILNANPDPCLRQQVFLAQVFGG